MVRGFVIGVVCLWSVVGCVYPGGVCRGVSQPHKHLPDGGDQKKFIEQCFP